MTDTEWAKKVEKVETEKEHWLPVDTLIEP